MVLGRTYIPLEFQPTYVKNSFKEFILVHLSSARDIRAPLSWREESLIHQSALASYHGFISHPDKHRLRKEIDRLCR